MNRANPRDAAEHVAHVGHDDASNQREADEARPGRDVDVDVEQHREPAKQGGQEVRSLGDLLCGRTVLGGCGGGMVVLLRVTEDEVDARLGLAASANPS